MTPLDTVVVGAGQAGLAMSRELTGRGVDHVVLDRGRVANSWRTERWDSLRLISPNWMNGLPGHPYRGPDRDGYMNAAELVERFEAFAAAEAVPLCPHTEVRAIRSEAGRYRVETSDGAISARSVVMASGACARAKVPAFAAEVPRTVMQTTPLTYKRASDLPPGGVLVVGASASGVQLAREIAESDRPVTLAVGSHTRGPRHYRGYDIDCWLELLGLFDVKIEDVDDLARVRRTPSMQLSGRSRSDHLDLNTLQDEGVEIVGRLAGIVDGRAQFSGSLANVCASSDLKMKRLLDAIDVWVEERGLAPLLDPPARFVPTRVPAAPRLSLDLEAAGIGTVVWACGMGPDHSAIELPVFDRKGNLRHDGGLVAPGLYVMGLPFLRRRKSHLIAGAGEDARDIAEALWGDLEHRRVA